MKRVVNLQAHILPALELGKGPGTMEESIQMLQALQAGGMTDIFCTPNVNESNITTLIDARNNAFENLKQAAEVAGLSVNLHSGAVVELSDAMVEYIANHRDTLVLGTSHFMLVSFKETSKVHHIDAWLKALQDMGITPIISEVESYKTIFSEPEHLLKWVDEGILMECNIHSFSEKSSHYRAVLNLYKNGLVHFLGTGFEVVDSGSYEFMETITKLDTQYKQDLLSVVRLNERDLLADRVFYPAVPSHWMGERPTFWTRLFSFVL